LNRASENKKALCIGCVKNVGYPANDHLIMPFAEKKKYITVRVFNYLTIKISAIIIIFA
jgi:hypothetical protein